MIPVIAAAIAAIELAERLANSSFWAKDRAATDQIAQAKAALGVANGQFTALCDALECAHDFGIALETARFTKQRYHHLLGQNTELLDKIYDLETKAKKQRKVKA